MSNHKNLLAIETSCDETAMAVLAFNDLKTNTKEKRKGNVIGLKNDEGIDFELRANHVLSQINLHREYGGVFPALAKREHAKNIVGLFVKTLKDANLYKIKNINLEKEEQEREEETGEKAKITKVKILLERESEIFDELVSLYENIEKPDLNYMAVTSGPGLAPALWVGINFAKAISILWDINIYPINHMEGHIVSALIKNKSEKYLIKNINYPAISLLISGGHTEIIYFEKFGVYKKLGTTLDDAVGEAFDKVARSMNLPYPGGPEISRLAEAGRNENIKIEKSEMLPRPMLHSPDLNFSFSGLKTSVIYLIKRLNNKDQNEILEKGESLEIDEKTKIKVSLDFENAVAEILSKKVMRAVDETAAKTLIIGGGVSANTHIKNTFEKLCKEEGVEFFIPGKGLSGDNAFMIGAAAMLQILNQKSPTKMEEIFANSNWSLESL